MAVKADKHTNGSLSVISRSMRHLAHILVDEKKTAKGIPY